ncbi:MAG: hypothetical protein MJ187_03825 [Alphaproteobacteria bacterium]|nr:hypothetical protein [Alphaproteobacteria bacterium]
MDKNISNNQKLNTLLKQKNWANRQIGLTSINLPLSFWTFISVRKTIISPCDTNTVPLTIFLGLLIIIINTINAIDTKQLIGKNSVLITVTAQLASIIPGILWLDCFDANTTEKTIQMIIASSYIFASYAYGIYSRSYISHNIKQNQMQSNCFAADKFQKCKNYTYSKINEILHFR